MGDTRVPHVRLHGAALGTAGLCNDILGMLGLDQATLIRSFGMSSRCSSFRSTFAYTNITPSRSRPHRREARERARTGRPCAKDILEPARHEREISVTAAAIETAANHAERLSLDA